MPTCATNFLRSVLAILALLLSAAGSRADDDVAKEPAPTATDKKEPIDLKQTTRILLATDQPERTKAIVRAIKAAPDRYSPPLLLALAARLFADGEKDDAVFWCFAGILRARFDANRCADESARGGASELRRIAAAPIIDYAWKDKEKLKTIVPRVFEWDRRTAHNYDQHWINEFGLGPTIEALGGEAQDTDKMSVPEDQWESIAEKTRQSLFRQFEEGLSPTGLGKPSYYFSDPQVVALCEAIEKNDLDAVDRLAGDGRASAVSDIKQPKDVYIDCVSPLDWAMRAKNKAAFRKLLDHEADPAQVLVYGNTVMASAAEDKDDSAWLQMLLEHGGDPNLAVRPGYATSTPTLIFSAVQSGNIKNVELLIEAGSPAERLAPPVWQHAAEQRRQRRSVRHCRLPPRTWSGRSSEEPLESQFRLLCNCQ